MQRPITTETTMLAYPIEHRIRLLGPTLIYIDSDGSLIELRLNNQQVRSIIADWNDQPGNGLSEGETPHVLSPPLERTAYTSEA